MLIGAVAGVLLLAGGLQALQQATVLVALPFVVVMLGLAVALFREVATDPAAQPKRAAATYGLRDALREVTIAEDVRSGRWSQTMPLPGRAPAPPEPPDPTR